MKVRLTESRQEDLFEDYNKTGDEQAKQRAIEELEKAKKFSGRTRAEALADEFGEHVDWDGLFDEVGGKVVPVFVPRDPNDCLGPAGYGLATLSQRIIFFPTASASRTTRMRRLPPRRWSSPTT